MTGTSTSVEVGGRRLALTNLNKILYPAHGFTKGELIDYYARIAPVLLPHVRDRPASFQRFPNGVDATGFFAKNAPAGTPDWVKTVRLPVPGSTKNREEIDYVLICDLPDLVWLANLAAIELHVPQWKVGPRGKVHGSDLVVFDLDPGAPASITECCEVALRLREELAADGLDAYPKTSGSKGMQLYAPIKPAPGEATSEYAKGLAERLERADPELIVSKMRRTLRPGKVFIDWSQNNPAKTTVAPYSVRARAEPTVSTPLTWDEVEAAEGLRFTTEDVLTRVGELGDLFEPLLDPHRPKLPS
ncbi:MAG: ATP-dependent ligase [Actinomycetia bacterium]|nr:ATP-dependent ligase [Actinomycetes bacterium]MDQ1652795.1 bifunctional non-ous end joining protein LigD [Cryptosporangiaceae bacterium]MDQ1655041.1 bifunctional non-ous end joining protein LigD [Cryptosporangiaceae bacterium]